TIHGGNRTGLIPGQLFLRSSSGADLFSLNFQIFVNPGGFDPPDVSIASPADQSQFTVPANVQIRASWIRHGSGDQPVNVLFYATKQGRTVLIGANAPDNGAPAVLTWNSVGPGAYSIRAVAYEIGSDNLTRAAQSA